MIFFVLNNFKFYIKNLVVVGSKDWDGGGGFFI